MKKKFEVREIANGIYSIFNNDMCDFQFVFDWDGTTTNSKKIANERCEQLNEVHDIWFN